MNADENNTLKDTFTSHPDMHWYFVKPGGNWGDHLIYAGAEKLANSVGVSWSNLGIEEIDSYDFDPTSSIYIHGSGGFNSWCSGTPFTILEKVTQKNVRFVVVGPQTVEQDWSNIKSRIQASLRNRKCTQVIFFTREQTSLNSMLEMDIACEDITIGITNDTALCLESVDALNLASFDKLPKKRYHLVARREDNEAPQDYVASSQHFLSVRLDPAKYCKTFEQWITIHAVAKSITTNRLHSAILGSILGIPVYLSAGSYHKNRSVWEHSLRDRRVNWIDTESVSKRNAMMLIPKRIRRSHKVNTLVRKLFDVPGC